MELGLILLDMFYRFEEHRIMEETAISNGLADACIVLQYTFTRADILMSYFRIAHLALRQTDRLTGSFHSGMRPFARNLIQMRCAREGNCIAFLARINSPAVHDNQDKRA